MKKTPSKIITRIPARASCSFLLFLLFTLAFFKTSFAANSTLTFADYLNQSAQQNAGYAASNAQSESANLLKKKSLLLTTPNFFALAKSSFAEQNQALTIFRYKQINTQNYSVGIEKTFDFGISSKFYYNLNRTAYQDFNSTTFPPINYQTSPTFDLTIPLWQGRFGKLTKASQASTYYKNETNKLNADALSVSFVTQTEKIYWNLAATQEITEIEIANLKQAQEIFEYINRRFKMNLSEKSDLLQAKASLESAKLQLKQAQNNEKMAARLFNKQRYVYSDIVTEKLQNIDLDSLEEITIDTKMKDSRYDIKAAEAAAKATHADAKIEEESNKPAFDLTAGYGLNGLQTQSSTAVSNSFQSDGRNGYVGLQFSMPIAIGLQSDIRQGARQAATAAKMDLRQKLIDQENDWDNLIQNLGDFKENLKLNRQIESVQKSKLENERKLLKQGRTSTYQILLFEQEYDRSRIATIQTAYKLLSLIADKKLYETDK